MLAILPADEIDFEETRLDALDAGKHPEPRPFPGSQALELRMVDLRGRENG
jgi:hypothetical protein